MTNVSKTTGYSSRSVKRRTKLVVGLVVLSLVVLVNVIGLGCKFLPTNDSVGTADNQVVFQKQKVTSRRMQRNVCERNPYLNAIEPATVVIDRMGSWLRNISAHGSRASEPLYEQKDHGRFFPFVEMTTCDSFYCVGGSCGEDESKTVCGLDKLHDGCIIYSIGGNNQWSFEEDLLERTPCEIHTFDCTGNVERFTPPNHPRMYFHHICLSAYHQPGLANVVSSSVVPSFDGKFPNKKNRQLSTLESHRRQQQQGKQQQGQQRRPPPHHYMVGESWTLLEMQQKLGHARIDLLKLDIEGWEHDIFQSWPELSHRPEAEEIQLPHQIVVEMHYITPFVKLHPEKIPFKRAMDFVHLQQHLLRMGYVVVKRDDNPICLRCTELTLVRLQCLSP